MLKCFDSLNQPVFLSLGIQKVTVVIKGSRISEVKEGYCWLVHEGLNVLLRGECHSFDKEGSIDWTNMVTV